MDSSQDLEKLLPTLGIIVIKPLERLLTLGYLLLMNYVDHQSFRDDTTHTRTILKVNFVWKKKSILSCFAGIKNPETNYCGQPHKLAWTWIYLQKYIYLYLSKFNQKTAKAVCCLQFQNVYKFKWHDTVVGSVRMGYMIDILENNHNRRGRYTRTLLTCLSEINLKNIILLLIKKCL